MMVAVLSLLLVFMDYWLDCAGFLMNCEGGAIVKLRLLIGLGIAALFMALSSANTMACTLSVRVIPIFIFFIHQTVSNCPKLPRPKGGGKDDCAKQAAGEFVGGVIGDMPTSVPDAAWSIGFNATDALSTYYQCAKGKPKDNDPDNPCPKGKRQWDDAVDTPPRSGDPKYEGQGRGADWLPTGGDDPYIPPKTKQGGPVWDKPSQGWRDEQGRSWKPATDHRGRHWDVQLNDRSRGHINVDPWGCIL
jgi:hypothetical protein